MTDLIKPDLAIDTTVQIGRDPENPNVWAFVCPVSGVTVTGYKDRHRAVRGLRRELGDSFALVRLELLATRHGPIQASAQRRHIVPPAHCKSTQPIAERLLAKSEPDLNSGCRLWAASLRLGGYGSIGINGRMQVATRVAYSEAYGPIPPGMCVCHRCDTPACINPAHLFLGTHRENMRDMVSKGRHFNGRAASRRDDQGVPIDGSVVKRVEG